MKKKILIIGLAVLIAVCGVSTFFHIKNKVESDNKTTTRRCMNP